MKELTKQEIIDVMSIAGEFQREVFRLYDIGFIEVTKYKSSLSISIHYNLSDVSYNELCRLFSKYFNKYRIFIYLDGCYSSIVASVDCAHFELKFYV